MVLSKQEQRKRNKQRFLLCLSYWKSTPITFQKKNQRLYCFSNYSYRFYYVIVHKIPIIFKVEQYNPDSKISCIRSSVHGLGSFLQKPGGLEILEGPQSYLAEHLPCSSLVSQEVLRGDVLCEAACCQGKCMSSEAGETWFQLLEKKGNWK